MTTGDFDPDLPVGEPGGYQPHGLSGGLFGPRPTPMPSEPISRPIGDFEPYTAVRMPAGYRAGGVTLRSTARLIDTVLCSVVIEGTSYTWLSWLDFIKWGVFTFFYFVVFESVLGWTPAKKVFGLSVHASSRAGAPKPNLVQAGMRNSFMLLLAIPYVGQLVCILFGIAIAVTIYRSPTKQGKLDLYAGTQVLRRGAS